MNPFGYVIFALGIAIGFFPMLGWHNYQDAQRAKKEADAQLLQEKKNVAIVTSYTDAVAAIADWHRTHPTRVFVPGTTTCPGGSAPSAADVLLTVGGIAPGERPAVDRGLLGNNDSSAIAH